MRKRPRCATNRPRAPRRGLRTATATLRALVDAIDDDAWNGPSGVADLTLGEGVLTLWYDTYVHADDIRAAAGRTSVRGDGSRRDDCVPRGRAHREGLGSGDAGPRRSRPPRRERRRTGDHRGRAAVRARRDRSRRRRDDGPRSRRQHLLNTGDTGSADSGHRTRLSVVAVASARGAWRRRDRARDRRASRAHLQPGQGAVPGAGRDQARSRRLLPRGRGADHAHDGRPAGADAAVPARRERIVVLPEAGARQRARLARDDDREHARTARRRARSSPPTSRTSRGR